MRFFVSVASLSLLVTGVLACTVETKSSGPAPAADGGVTGSGDGGVRSSTPIKAPSTTKDAGTTQKTPTQNDPPTTCKGAVECLAACDEDATCEDGCYGGMTEAELKKLQNISLCIADSGCTTDECVLEVCADVINECFGN